jgi:ribonuclease HI
MVLPSDNGDPAAEATYAVCFGKGAGYVNDHDVVPARENQNSNAAALYSVKRAIEQAENALALEDPATQRPINNYVLIIKTHSSYVAKCLSYHIKEWEANESRETIAEAATNGLLFEVVENLIREAETECRFRVKFWLVGKEYNEKAIALAKKSWHAPRSFLLPQKMVR